MGRAVHTCMPRPAAERVLQAMHLPGLRAASSPAHEGAEGPARVRPRGWAARSVRDHAGPGSSLCHSRLASRPQPLGLYLSFVVLVRFHNKMPHWMALKTCLFLIVQEAGKFKIRALAGLASGEDLFAGVLSYPYRAGREL